MSRLSMTLNGWNCSFAFNKWGSVYTPIKVEGPNSGQSMGGIDIIDLVNTKDCWELQGNPLKEADYRKMLSLGKQAYITAVYPDPETGTETTKVMVPTLGAATYTPIRAGEVWYVGWTLTLKER